MLVVTFAFCALAQADVFGYKIDVTTEYQFGGPPAGPTFLGCCTGAADTGFVIITNNGTTTFTGSIGASAVSGFGVDFSQSFAGLTLSPGQAVSFSVNDESSNQGGYGGAFGSIQTGIGIFLSGFIQGTEAVNLSVNDADIHSGVPRTNPFGVTLDSYVIQGGDPTGQDTGDAFETTQAPGQFEFFQAATRTATAPEPQALALLGTVAALLGARKKLFRKAS
jgi:hypothetical protein